MNKLLDRLPVFLLMTPSAGLVMLLSRITPRGQRRRLETLFPKAVLRDVFAQSIRILAARSVRVHERFSLAAERAAQACRDFAVALQG